MAFSDLRSFIQSAASIGEARTISGADWNLEIGCLTELMGITCCGSVTGFNRQVLRLHVESLHDSL